MSRLSTFACSFGLLLAACGAPVEPDADLDGEGASGVGGSGMTGDGDGLPVGGTNSSGGATGIGGMSGVGGGTIASGGGTTTDTGGTASGGATVTGPVADIFQHCDFGGWGVELELGDYTTADLVALGATDNNVSSVQVSPGYEVILFDGNNFTGNSLTLTSDTACTVSQSFNDITSSIRVQEAGNGSGGATSTGGSSGSGGSDGIGGVGPTSCQPAFETACKPDINFNNQHSDGGGALFDDLFPDFETAMKDITCTVCSILYRDPDEIPQNKRHSTVNVTIDAHDGVAYASGNSITISVNHLQNFNNPDSAYVEYRGVLVHETAHLYQHYGNGGTGEGMADAVRIRVGLYPQGRCNVGGSWRDAYTTSGCFYSWLTGPSVYHSIAYESYDANLPYKINATLSGTSGEGAYTAVSNLLQSTFGQSVEDLWDLYQADL